ncbi:MAG: hypothetical protein AB7O24_25655 [Kofleriaceae bacterium]
MTLWSTLILLGACRSGADVQPDAPVSIDATDKAAPCVATFGQDLTDGFGRLDGTVVAVLAPGNQTCPRPNSTHLIIEVAASGQVYRMVVSTKSTSGHPVMALAERDAALAGPAWQDGWHTGIPFDYVTTLGLHREDFTATPQAELASAITSRLELGARVSVFGTVEGQPDSAHLIHRNAAEADGAIVINPDTSPHYMLLRFDNQLF